MECPTSISGGASPCGRMQYLPGGTLSALAGGGTAELGYLAAIGLAVVYGLSAVTGSAWVFRRREIVS